MSHNTAAAKQQLRAEIRARRAGLKARPEQKTLLDDAIATATLACAAHFGAERALAAYSPLPSEPGPADFPARLAAGRRTVWLPISLPDGVLAWAEASDTTRAGALGITEPDGTQHSSEVLQTCQLIIAPAMAVDHRGMRLGKGAGYYDRALADLGVPVAAVVYDEEFLPHVPGDAHDVPVHAVITPRGFHVL